MIIIASGGGDDDDEDDGGEDDHDGDDDDDDHDDLASGTRGPWIQFPPADSKPKASHPGWWEMRSWGKYKACSSLLQSSNAPCSAEKCFGLYLTFTKPYIKQWNRTCCWCSVGWMMRSWLVRCSQAKSLTLSLLRVINVKIPLQPHKKYDITQYGELDFS